MTAADERPAWASDPETLEKMFHASVSQGDARGVDASLRLLAACAPRRAVELYDSLELALAVAKCRAEG